MGFVLASEPDFQTRDTCRLNATLSASSVNTPTVVARLRHPGGRDYAVDPQLSGTLSLDLAQALIPRTAGIAGARGQVIAPLRVSVDGTELDRRYVGRVSFLETEAGSVVTFDTAEVADSPEPALTEPPLGAPEDYHGLPGGTQSVDLDADFLTPNGVKTVRLLTNGVIDNADGSLSVAAGDTRAFSAVGAHGRYDGMLISVSFAPGHGFTLGEMVEQILAAAGLSVSLNLPDDKPRYKELQLTEQPWTEAVDGLLGAAGKRLHWRRDGTPAVVDIVPAPGSTAFDVDLQPGDWLDPPGVRESAVGDGPTRVKVVGDAQPVHAAGAGRRTVINTIEISQVYTRRRATHTIGAGGTPLAVTWGFSEATVLQLVRRIVITREFEIQTLISQRTETYAWVWPEAIKGTQLADGDTSWAIGTYLESEDGPARQYSREYFGLERVEVVEWQFGDPALPAAQRGDLLTKQIKSIYEWRPVYGHNSTIQYVVNPSPPPAETTGVSWRNGVSLLWSGEAVEESSEGLVVISGVPPGGDGAAFRIVSRETTTYESTSDGFVKTQILTLEQWLALPGRTYFYEGREAKAETSEFFRVVETQTTAYVSQGEALHQEIVAVQNAFGETVELIDRPDVEGFLPATERRDVSVNAAGQSASRLESQAIEGEWIAEDLEENRLRRDALISDRFVETVDEATERARREIREGAAVPTKFQLPANVGLKVGDVCRVALRSRHGSRTLLVQVQQVQANDDGRGALVVDVDGRWFPL